MSEVIIASKNGIDAGTATDPNSFIFHSSYNTFKIVYQGLTTITMSSAADWHSFTHNSPLASTSAITIFIKFPDGKMTPISYASGRDEAWAYPQITTGSGHSAGFAYWDNTNIYFRCANVSVSYNVTLAWFIFEAAL